MLLPYKNLPVRTKAAERIQKPPDGDFMESIPSFAEVVRRWESLPDPGRLYLPKDLFGDFDKASFWVISSAEAKDQEMFEDERGSPIPMCFKGLNVRPWLDTATFRDIVQVVLERTPLVSLENTDVFIRAVRYYLEFDTFEPQ